MRRKERGGEEGRKERGGEEEKKGEEMGRKEGVGRRRKRRVGGGREGVGRRREERKGVGRKKGRVVCMVSRRMQKQPLRSCVMFCLFCTDTTLFHFCRHLHRSMYVALTKDPTVTTATCSSTFSA